MSQRKFSLPYCPCCVTDKYLSPLLINTDIIDSNNTTELRTRYICTQCRGTIIFNSTFNSEKTLSLDFSYKEN